MLKLSAEAHTVDPSSSLYSSVRARSYLTLQPAASVVVRVPCWTPIFRGCNPKAESEDVLSEQRTRKFRELTQEHGTVSVLNTS